MTLYPIQKSYGTNTGQVDRLVQKSWKIKPELKKALELSIKRGKVNR